MKIYIPNTFSNSDTLKGKGLFCKRLGISMVEQGYNITDDINAYADVSLNVVSIKHRNSKKKVLRLAGVYHDIKLNYNDKNAGMKNSLKSADAVVYQSNHAKKMCDKYIGKYNGLSAVIYNGANPKDYNIKKLNRPFEHTFIAIAKWRPHKRLKDIIESFLLANIKNSELLVAGPFGRGMDIADYEKYFKLNNINYLGDLPHKVLANYLVSAKASIHLCWFDGCPNDSVESLVAGVPVICNNVGGTPELINIAGGIICDIDEPYDLKPVDLYNPPKIDRSIVANAIIKCSKEKMKIDASLLKINAIAKNYLSLMESL